MKHQTSGKLSGKLPAELSGEPFNPNKKLWFLATCSPGLEPFLKKELQQFGISQRKIQRTSVAFQTTFVKAARFTWWSRIASRVYLKIAEFPVDPRDLASACARFDWEKELNSKQTFKISANLGRFRGEKSQVKNSLYLAQCIKDGLCDRFAELRLTRPYVDKKLPDHQFMAFLTPQAKDPWEKLSLYREFSDGPLSNRGYRSETGEAGSAPIRETLAAALVDFALSDQTNTRLPILDPMCGSGTLLIESAVYRLNLPGSYLKIRQARGEIHRTQFGFLKAREVMSSRKSEHTLTPGLMPELQKTFREDFDLIQEIFKSVTSKDLNIEGRDQNPAQLQNSNANLKRAGFDRLITVAPKSQNFLETRDSRFLITNPPYGVRLEKKDPVFKKLSSSRGCFVYPYEQDLEKNSSQKTNFKPSEGIEHIVSNGSIQCGFFRGQ